jgi:putative flippase GtrA
MIYSEFYSFLIFIVIAVVRTLLDILLWQVLVWYFKDDFFLLTFFKKIGLNLNKFALAQAVSFVVSSIISYTSNKSLAFGNDDPTTLWLVTKFSIVTLAGLMASVIFIEFMTTNEKVLSWVSKYSLLQKHWPLVAKVLTIGITVVINYGGMRFWVFN